MRVVMDTNVLISSLGWDGPEHELLMMVFSGRLNASISPDILQEFAVVAGREKFGSTRFDIDEFMTLLMGSCDVVVPDDVIDVIKVDPMDNMVLECAVKARSDVIVTGDRHLLTLEEYDGIRIIRVSTFLKELHDKL